MTKNIFRFLSLLVLAASLGMAQLTTTQTNFSAAVALTGAGTSGNTIVTLASCTNTVLPSVSQVGSYIWVDWESMQVATLVSGTIGGSGSCVLNMKRAQLGTKQGAHATTAVVYVTNQATGTGDSSRPFSGGALIGADPQGSCTASSNYSLPVISWMSGRVWTCPTTGPLANNWAVVYDPSAIFSITDGALFVPFSACQTSVSGNSTGTNGYTVAGTSNLPVVQAQTSSTGTNTHTYTCHIPIPTRTRGSSTGPGAGAAISDVVFIYGVQGGALGTQVNTLASGTFNGSTVFGKVVLPTPAASETASTVAPARADAGTMAITPVVGSFNVATTTAGAFFTAKFTPATPVLMNADLTDYVVTITLQATATTATTTNSPGLYVHIIGVPL